MPALISARNPRLVGELAAEVGKKASEMEFQN